MCISTSKCTKCVWRPGSARTPNWIKGEGEGWDEGEKGKGREGRMEAE